MINHHFNTVEVSDGTSMELYVAFPEKGTNHPVIIVIQEAFGVNSHIRNICERLCKEGYAVVSPDLYHRTAHLFEGSYTDFPSIAPHYQAITIENLKADLQASYHWVTTQENVNNEKVACIGFCLGGRVAFIANTFLPLAAGLSYYGGGLDLLTEEAPNLIADHAFYWGGKDAHITPDKVQKVIDAVRDAGKNYSSMLISYADHGFNCDERASYHPLAAKEAWSHSLSFLANRLKS